MAIIQTERKILSKEEIGTILDRVKERLLTENIPFESLYLFGSYASGDAHRDSDVDIAVVLSPSYREGNLSDIIRRWGKDINVKTELQVLFSDDFENRYLSLPAYVKKFGIVYH